MSLFAAVTLAAAGGLPDWGEYLAYLREFLAGDTGDLTYDVPRWTPGLVVGAAYLASAAALAELARRRGPLVERERPALIAITGVTAYGSALMSYYVDRSLDHILIYVALPVLLAGALWLGLLLRCRDAVGRTARTAGLALSLAVAALVVAVGWGAIDARFPRSALAHAAPGGSSLRGALERLWHPPPLAPAAPAGEQALRRSMPGERESLVMVQPDLGHRDPAPQRPRGQAAPRRSVGGQLRRGGGAAPAPGRGRCTAPRRPDAPRRAGPPGARRAAGEPVARRARRARLGARAAAGVGAAADRPALPPPARRARPRGLHGRGAGSPLTRRAST